MVRVSVIVPNYNGASFLADCIVSLENQNFKDFECIIVDNGSTDDSKKIIKEKFSWVKLVCLEKNFGFAYASIKGFEESKGEDIVLLNNDAIAFPNWLENLLKTLMLDEKIGMVGTLVLDKKTNAIESIGLMPARNGLVYLQKEFKKNIAENYLEIFGASAVAVLYRRKMLEEVGFFESDYFAYYEDADLAFRARRRGWKAVVCLDAKVYHTGSATSLKLNKKDFYLARNKLRTILRNWDTKLIIKNLPWIAGYELASFLGEIILLKKGIVQARIDFLKSLKKDIKFRKKELKIQPEEYELKIWLAKKYPGLDELWRRRI